MQKYHLKTVSTTDAVRDALENDIYSLHFPPGSKITESDLALRYGVSRNTLREAITYLQSDGILEKFPNKGIYVKEVTIEDVIEIFNLRAMLECESVKEIVMQKKDVSSLKTYLEKVIECNRKGDWNASMNADIAFHSHLVHLSDNSRLIKLYETILAEVKLCIFQSCSFSEIMPKNEEQHLMLVKYIEHGKLDLATDILSKHIAAAIHTYTLGLANKKKQT